ncbi:hypothetical protein EG68_07590 [Paragonimus skrjabini miyazakii]|uniref:FHA domain-containing protein n=1 Tax=Paragonimus skrjabini miyazakii TaxID=59628 RepID=A0A8S9YUD0_9TREM|nr:hypothetical protein EG68_07590 [Paragonimus skrjabini miyazakii]
MSTVTLRWIGDLDQDKREQAGCVSSSSDQYRPKKIELKPGQKEIRIGRINTKNPPDYPIESCINNRMISRNHATIERSAKGGSILYDHSMNGTYVNYTRVLGGVTLKHGDIVCFGHLNGANLKPGEKVSLFYSDLKYKVELSDTSPSKDTSVGSAVVKKRKPNPPQAGSTVSSTQRSDWEDEASDDSGDDPKRIKTASGTPATARTTNKHKPFKKPGTSTNRRKLDDEEEDEESEEDDDDLDDTSAEKRSSSATKANKKKTNGTEKNKKNAVPNSVSRKPSGTKVGHKEKDKRIKPSKSSKGGGVDGDADASGNEMFHYDTEECSARPCKQPQDIAIDWIQCDKCTLWYHQDVIEAYLELKLDADKFDDESNLTKILPPSKVLPVVRSAPLPNSPFYRLWHELGRLSLTSTKTSDDSTNLICFDPVYIPPDRKETTTTTSEGLVFSTHFHNSLVRIQLRYAEPNNNTSESQFEVSLDPWVDLEPSQLFAASALSPIDTFVRNVIWPALNTYCST